MQTAILQSNSKSDIQLILQLANKLKVKTRVLSEQDIEDICLINAIKEGETGERIDIDKYLKKLTK
jgi:hypothetical protein